MTRKRFNRDQLAIKPLGERENKVLIERDHVAPAAEPGDLCAEAGKVIRETAGRIAAARKNERSVMLAFGAHAIKNALGPVIIRLVDDGWVTHLATNGAGIIHDWEFAFQGASAEDVRRYMSEGQFGLWDETGRYINLAIAVGAYEGLGYGESVGAMIQNDGLRVPPAEELKRVVRQELEGDADRSAAAADLFGIIKRFGLKPGWMSVPHPFKKYSVQCAAYREKVPFTGHPMIGQDIIYSHPMNHGGAVGRTGLRDFLSFAESVNRLDGGVYVSLGSAVMSPMVFEKAFSMCQNVHIRKGRPIGGHYIVVVDLAPASGEWRNGAEPLESDPSYYARYLKTFNRVGGTMRYASAHNRDFLLALCGELKHGSV